MLRAIGEPFVAVAKGIVRTSSFFFKEIWAAVRQPKLVLSVLLGPFLILAAFGVGYRGQTPQLDTVLVLPPDQRLPDDPAAYRDMFSSVFVLKGVTRDRAQAENELDRRQVDVVVIVPDQAEQTVLSGSHAQFDVLFREIDPLQAAWVRYFATVAVQELNRRVLADLLGNTREPLDRAAQSATAVRTQADGLASDIQRNDGLSAAGRVIAMRQALQAARTAPGYSVLSAMGGKQADPLAPAEADLAAIEGDLARGQVNTPDQVVRAQRLQTTSREMEQQTQAATRVPPDVLAAPFSVQASNTVPAEPTAIAFFAPAVVALLLQHIAVSLASLSMVRDRLLGATEVYRVAPVTPFEIILGKTLSYGLLLGVVGVALFFLVNRLLGVPMLGQPVWAAASLALLLFSSLGLGFFIAGLAETETQAVQLAMLVLLASIFFGGFFLALDTLWEPIRAISYVLPVTFGSIDLRDVMLRGAAPDPLMLGALGLIGAVCYAVASFELSRRMATQ
ncbi:MAG: ABC transporter permease [Chloroflexi bacterium]|nr:ABC transporter permease [Chloroflexota bacterium]